MNSPARTIARALAVSLVVAAARLALAQDAKTGGPYVPTPQAVVDAMLDFAKVGPRDFVIDLGSGDGRIVLTAARRYHARGIGVDIDQDLVNASTAEADRQGLADRVSFQRQDVLEARIQDATVLTLYLLPGMMHLLQTKFMRELRPGTRIVSHDFTMGEWKPDRERSLDVQEKYGTRGDWKSTLYYWVVPARVDGAWRFALPDAGEEPLMLQLTQHFQEVAGVSGGAPAGALRGRLDGERIDFSLNLGDGVYHLRGVVSADRMRGDVEHAGKREEWSAVRANAPAPMQ
jgi:hypothetical protein